MKWVLFDGILSLGGMMNIEEFLEEIDRVLVGGGGLISSFFFWDFEFLGVGGVYSF